MHETSNGRTIVQVIEQLGIEAGSTVVIARDLRSDHRVKVKIVRSRYPEQGEANPWLLPEFLAYERLREVAGTRLE